MQLASPVAEHGLQGVWALVAAARGLSSCGSQALAHKLKSCGPVVQDMRDLPGSGIEPISPALVGKSFTIEPPGKPQ